MVCTILLLLLFVVLIVEKIYVADVVVSMTMRNWNVYLCLKKKQTILHFLNMCSCVINFYFSFHHTIAQSKQDNHKNSDDMIQ